MPSSHRRQDDALRAHAFARAGQQAIDRRTLGDAIGFAQSARLLSQGLDSPLAREAELLGFRIESWAHHYVQDFALAAYLAYKAEELAGAVFPNTWMTAHARLRRIEVAEVQTRHEWALAGYQRLINDLEGCVWGTDLRLAASYGAVSAATKLGQLDAADLALRCGNAALLVLGDHRWEWNLRKHEAQLAIRRGQVARAHQLMIEYAEQGGDSLDGLMILSHLHFANGEVESGVDFASSAIEVVRKQSTAQKLEGFLRFVGPLMPPDLRVEVRQAHDEVVSAPLSSRGDVASPD